MWGQVMCPSVKILIRPGHDHWWKNGNWTEYIKAHFNGWSSEYCTCIAESKYGSKLMSVFNQPSKLHKYKVYKKIKPITEPEHRDQSGGWVEFMMHLAWMKIIMYAYFSLSDTLWLYLACHLWWWHRGTGRPGPGHCVRSHRASGEP